MIKFYHIKSGLLGVNTYFLANEKNNAVVIDAGENYKIIKQSEETFGIKVIAEFLTHAHFDHAGNAKKLQDDGVKIYISKIDGEKLSSEENLANPFGKKFDRLVADYTFSGGETIDIDGIKIEVIATPGHSDGSVTYKVEDMLFTGDTLFDAGIGRTDFPFGNEEDMKNSLKKLYSLKGDYKVYPGHGEFTTLEKERKTNPVYNEKQC